MYRNQTFRFILHLRLTICVMCIIHMVPLRYSYFNGSHFLVAFDFPVWLARLSENVEIPITIYDQTSCKIFIVHFMCGLELLLAIHNDFRWKKKHQKNVYETKDAHNRAVVVNFGEHNCEYSFRRHHEWVSYLCARFASAESMSKILLSDRVWFDSRIRSKYFFVTVIRFSDLSSHVNKFVPALFWT